MLIVQRTALHKPVVASVLWYVEQRRSVSGNWYVVGLGSRGLYVAWVVDFATRAKQAKRGAVVHSLDP